MKTKILLLSVLLSSTTLAATMEDRLQYIDNFSMATFVTPGEQASYYWQNIAEVMPTAVISRNGAVKPLLKDVNSNFGETTINNKKISDYLQGDSAELEALMVIEDGIITYEHFNIDPKQKHVWMSNAKTIAGLTVALLEEDGLINVQKPLGNYIPQVQGTAWENIKIIDLLNQQSGLDHEENESSRNNPNSYISQFMQSEVKGDDYLENLLKIPSIKKPGKVFEYSSANTQMLGLLISTVTDKRLSDVIEKRIWSKAGMTSDSLVALSPKGYEIIHGVFSSNLEDMMRFGLLFTPSWYKTAEEKVVSDNVLKVIRTSVTPQAFENGSNHLHFVNMTRDMPLGTSYQWDQIWDDGDMYKSGMRGQGIYVSPDKDLVIGWFSNKDIEVNAAAYARVYAKNKE